MALEDLFDEDAEDSEAEDAKPEGSPAPSDEGEGDDLEDSSEEEGDEEGAGDYDYTDKFLAREDEDEGAGGAGSEGEGDEESARKKKKRRKREELVLEEEDYDLLEENQVTGIRRPRGIQRKRIRKQTAEEAEADSKARTAAERLREELGFRDDAEGLEDVEDDAPVPAPRLDEPMFDESDEEDEFRDFIVDDEPGAGGAVAAPRRAIRRAGLPAGVSTAALREAQDIFGDVSGLLDFYQSRRRPADAEDADEPLLDEEAFGDDEEAAEAYRLEQEAKAKARAERRARAQVEPTLMEAHHLLPEDERLRATDAPERLLLAWGRDPENADAAAAAEWIYVTIFGPNATESAEQRLVDEGILEVDGPPPDGRPMYAPGELYGELQYLRGHRGLRRARRREERREWRKNRVAQQRLQESIRSVVQLIWSDQREVPVIACYHKETAGELLALRRTDAPGTTSRAEMLRAQDAQRPECPEGTVQAKHRRIRRWDAMWAVYNASVKWRALQRRREARAAVFRESLQAAPPSEQPALQEALDSLQAAQSLEAIADADAKHRLAAAGAEAALAELSLSQDGSVQPGSQNPKRRAGGGGGGAAAYLAGKRAGLDEVVAAYGITPAQLAENLELDYKKHEPEDRRVEPDDLAAGHITDDARAAGLQEAEGVLARARLMAAQQLAVEPGVRAFVRKVLSESATVTTEATMAGEVVIDAFHPYGRVARLEGKPVDKFEGTDHFLRAVLAEREGLLTVKVELPRDKQDRELMRTLRNYYLSDAVSTVAQKWNAERERVLEDAVRRLLLPPLLGELRSRLATRARETVAHDAAERFWQLATVAPLKVQASGEEEEVTERRVMAAVWGPGGEGQPATTLVMLDAQGGLVDLLLCSQLSGSIPRAPRGPAVDAGGFYSIFTDTRKSKDAERIKDFLVEHAPHVVAVGAAGLEARQLKADLDAIRDSILEHHARVMTAQETGNIDVQFVEEPVAAVWADSAAAKEELGDQAPSVRRAVALGRCLLEPLPVLASLCGSGKEVLALPLHPLQSALPQEDILRVVDQTLVTVVSQVGVDINAAANSQWLSSTLPFVPGLGPRKARALLQAVVRATGVESRHALYKELGVLGETVFINAGPFIRIRAVGSELANAQMQVLDDTRVQPMHYKYAMQVAASAIGENEAEDGAAVVEAAMQRPDDVEALDLSEYVEHLRHVVAAPTAKLPQQSILTDIRFELLAPFAELRPEREPLREEEVFWLLVGDKSALKEGRLVEARVRRVTPQAAFCILPDIGNIEAVISADAISSSGACDPRDRMRPNDVIKGRITTVDVARFEVQLTTASDALRDDDNRWEIKYCATDEDGLLDRYYKVVNRRERDETRRREAAKAAKKVFVKRPIRHPLFKNMSMAEAVAHLQEHGEDGDCLFRPHTRGTHMLQLTIRYKDPCYVNVEVKEGAKAAGGMGAHLKLGKPLMIHIDGQDEPLKFDDLDEVVANYVEPVVGHVKELIEHPKFRDGEWRPASDAPTALTIQNFLREEKAKSGGRAVYCFGICYDLPRMMFLGHILQNSPRREKFSIVPNGFYFRKRVYRKLDHVINEFKRRPLPPTDERDSATAADLGYAPPQADAAPPPPPPAQQAAYGSNGYGADAYAAPASAGAGAWQQPAYPQAAYQTQPPWGAAAAAATGAAYPSTGAPYQPPPPPSYPQYGAAAPTQQQVYGAAVPAPQQQQQPGQAFASAQATAQALAARFQAEQAQQQAAQQAAGVPPPPPSFPAYAGQ